MYESLLKEYELATMEAEHMFECATDTFTVKSIELLNMEKCGYFSESDQDEYYLEASANYLSAVKAFFKTTSSNMKKLSTKAANKVKEAKPKILSRLSMLKEKNKTNTKKVEYFDTAAYVKSYSNFSKKFSSMLKGLHSKVYNDKSEYDKVYKDFSTQIDAAAKEFDTLNKTWYKSSAVNKLSSYIEKETSNSESLVNTISGAHSAVCSVADSMTGKMNDVGMIQDIKTLVSKYNSIASKAIVKVAAEPSKKVSLMKE